MNRRPTDPPGSAPAETELLAELLIAEFEGDFAPLDAPSPVLLGIAVGIAVEPLSALKLSRAFEQMMLRGNAERLFPRFKLK